MEKVNLEEIVESKEIVAVIKDLENGKIDPLDAGIEIERLASELQNLSMLEITTIEEKLNEFKTSMLG